MGILEEFLPYLGVSTLAFSILTIFNIGIDSINMTEIEKKISTDSDKALMVLSRIVLIVSLYTLLFVLWLVFVDKSIVVNSIVDYIILTISSFILVLLIGILVHVIISFCVNMFMLKSVYFINRVGNDKWYIIRRVDKNTLLLRQKKNYMFIDVEEVNGNEIYGEYESIQKIKKYSLFYLFDIRIEVIKWVAVILLLVFGHHTSSNVEDEWKILISFIIIVITGLHSIIAHLNKETLQEE